MEEYLDSLSPEERKKVQDQLDNLDSDLFETTPEDLDAFVKEKFPNGRVLNGRIFVGNQDLGKVLDLYKADAYNNFLQGVGAEKFMQEIGVVNDPDITGSNVLDDPQATASTDRINQSIQESQGASDSQINNINSGRPTTRAMKFLKALDFLDPVEKVATGLLTALNLPNLARGYITYEVANLVGNLLMGGFKSTGDVQLMNSLILTGGSPEEIKAAKERIENTGAETLARIDKFSITGNIYEQIGKMLNR
tara:strand:- start:265 stop:1017 length:753 start_codon:yes stop_codon:yes gene_type:complete